MLNLKLDSKRNSDLENSQHCGNLAILSSDEGYVEIAVDDDFQAINSPHHIAKESMNGTMVTVINTNHPSNKYRTNGRQRIDILIDGMVGWVWDNEIIFCQ